jgi:hypothetical protein
MPRCGHWDVLGESRCPHEGVVRVRCTDEGDTWEGVLCAEHLAAYQADPDIDVVVR